MWPLAGFVLAADDVKRELATSCSVRASKLLCTPNQMQLLAKPIREDAHSFSMFGLRWKDKIVTDVGNIFCSAVEGRHQLATCKFAFGKSYGF